VYDFIWGTENKLESASNFPNNSGKLFGQRRGILLDSKEGISDESGRIRLE
jgi:hypothetical protein